MSDPSTAVIHFYRASTAHADVWRQRMDTTTNWAVVTNAGILSFALSSKATPHFVMLMVLIIDIFFLVMESRRYQVYDLWHHRLRIMQRYVFAEALSDEPIASDKIIREKLRDLAEHLGHTVARIGLIDAIGFRIRRNYFYILIFTVGAWLMKLDFHPDRPNSIGEIIARAEMGPFSGPMVISFVAVLMTIALFLAIRAPSEHLVDWSRQPSPLRRALRARWLSRAATSDEIAQHPAPESFPHHQPKPRKDPKSDSDT